jgi:spore maturation protein A
MLNTIWFFILIASTVTALVTGNLKQLVGSVTESASTAVNLALGLAGIMALWLGIMRIALDSGLVDKVTWLITPIMRRLFPEVPKDHPAHAGMAMNIVANMFGLNNAATPLGIKAMEQLDDLNTHKGTATDAMCMFLAINTSSVQLIPMGAIAILAAGGASDPTVIVFPAIMATMGSTIAGVVSAKFLAKRKRYELNSVSEENL